MMGHRAFLLAANRIPGRRQEHKEEFKVCAALTLIILTIWLFLVIGFVGLCSYYGSFGE